MVTGQPRDGAGEHETAADGKPDGLDAALTALAGMALTIDQVQDAFPAWRVFRSQDGRWHARRPGVVTPYGPESLLRRYLVAGTPGGLAEQLGVQEFLDALDPGALAKAWREARLPWPDGGDDDPVTFRRARVGHSGPRTPPGAYSATPGGRDVRGPPSE